MTTGTTYLVKDKATGEYVDERGNRTPKQGEARRWSSKKQASGIAKAWRESEVAPRAGVVRITNPPSRHTVEVRETDPPQYWRVYLNGHRIDGQEIREVAETIDRKSTRLNSSH